MCGGAPSTWRYLSRNCRNRVFSPLSDTFSFSNGMLQEVNAKVKSFRNSSCLVHLPRKLSRFPAFSFFDGGAFSGSGRSNLGTCSGKEEKFEGKETYKKAAYVDDNVLWQCGRWWLRLQHILSGFHLPGMLACDPSTTRPKLTQTVVPQM